jgi:hypothetical protein
MPTRFPVATAILLGLLAVAAIYAGARTKTPASEAVANCVRQCSQMPPDRWAVLCLELCRSIR